MSHLEGLYQWQETVVKEMPCLTRCEAVLWALWSFGMVWARSCAQTAVVVFLAPVLGVREGSLRQRLREFCYEAADKQGEQRQQIEVRGCFRWLLGWVMKGWEGAQVALACDATTLADRFVVLVVSVLYRGCAIPVAWVVLPAGKKHGWRKEWLHLLRRVKEGMPSDKRVIVLADRGLYARWLFRRIVRLGWHPLLRINVQGQFRPAGAGGFGPLSQLAPRPGTRWAGRGIAFKTKERQLPCTVLAYWQEGCEAAWVVVTDLPPEAADACWYGLRAWIERGFKVLKSAGWQWDKTRMTDPQRAERLWLAMAVATLWLLQVGGEAEEEMPDSTLWTLPGPAPRRQRRASRLRMVSVFRRGLARLLAAWLRHAPLPLGRFLPEPWPDQAWLERIYGNAA